MLSPQVVHSIGSTIYFTLSLLFFLTSRVPRTNSGPRWWAGAALVACVARVSFAVLDLHDNVRLAVLAYAALKVWELPLLIIGVERFLSSRSNNFVLWGAAVEATVLIAAVGGTGASYRWGEAVLGLFHGALFIYLARVMYRQQALAPGRVMFIASATCLTSAIHWLLAFPLIHWFPVMGRLTFLIGTMLELTLYLTLLASVLMLLHEKLFEAEGRALEMAYIDPLTGLSNKRNLRNFFENALHQDRRAQRWLALIYIDLDNFKPINDSAGHNVGDEILRTLAARLSANVRSTDICARVGGDEFVVVATQLRGPGEVEPIVKQLLGRLAEGISVGDDRYFIGASIGISLYPVHGQDLEQLIIRADAAMYDVKRTGKGGHKVFEATGNNA